MEQTNATENDFPEWILGVIRCPNSGTLLTLASAQLLSQLRDLHARSPLTNKIGRTVSILPTQGLVSQDGRWFYSIHQGIPCLLPDEAILLPPALNN
ncbi:MAG: hypothetical protein ACK449_13320 [Planctomycetota bacterium]